jgi:hypothetical protein
MEEVCRCTGVDWGNLSDGGEFQNSVVGRCLTLVCSASRLAPMNFDSQSPSGDIDRKIWDYIQSLLEAGSHVGGFHSERTDYWEMKRKNLYQFLPFSKFAASCQTSDTDLRQLGEGDLPPKQTFGPATKVQLICWLLPLGSIKIMGKCLQVVPHDTTATALRVTFKYWRRTISSRNWTRSPRLPAKYMPMNSIPVCSSGDQEPNSLESWDTRMDLLLKIQCTQMPYSTHKHLDMFERSNHPHQGSASK